MLSFIIPAYNEEQLLGRALTVLKEAARAAEETFEIVVVDDAFTDRTALIAQEHGARLIAVKKRQIAATRNAGAREARGDLFLFVDADTIVTEPDTRSRRSARRPKSRRWPFVVTPSLPKPRQAIREREAIRERGGPTWIRSRRQSQ